MSTATLSKTADPVALSLNKILDEFCEIYLERRALVEAALLTILAKFHMFVLAPPGTAKSDLFRELVARFPGARYYETLLSKTRPDAAVLGPYDLPLLRDKGDFHRKIEGFLPTANFALLDEIGKMSMTLGHDLLAALNERLYHEVNGGRSAHPIPLYSAFCPSNEMITEESDDAAALWDRLHVRATTDYIQESGNFALLLQSGVAGNDPRLNATSRTEIDFADLAKVVDEVVPVIDVPMNVIEGLVRLRDELRSQEITVSDRRWRQGVRLIQAATFLRGGTQAEEDDIQVMRYMLWEDPRQINAVERVCLSLSNPVAEAAMELLDDVEDIARGIRDRKGQSLEARAAYGTEANGKLKVITAELAQKRQECIAAGRSTTKLDEVGDRIAAVRRSVYVDCLDMDPSTIR